MTLRMADGPVANLPEGMDAYGGYVNKSGIGITYPEVVAKFPGARHLSITTNGTTPAMCADVEPGAMSEWLGFLVGYCSISEAQSLINRFGRPPKLWTAHYTGVAHICNPSCGFGFTGYADGTQWTTHNNVYDESALLDNFFDFQNAPPPAPQEKEMVIASTPTGNGYYIVKPDGSVEAYGDAAYHGGINNAGPNGSSALVAGDAATGVTVRPQGGYWIITEKGLVYAFGGAPHYGNAV